MAGRTIAIGDIHGCSEALRALLDAVNPQPDDTIVTLGDYVDRGPNSRDVVEQILALRERCELVTLLGNHELMLLMAKEGAEHQAWWEHCGGTATLQSYRPSDPKPTPTNTNDHANGEDSDADSVELAAEESAQGSLEWIPPSHIDFFESCALAYETETHIFVHANYEAKLPISEQNEEVLLWRHLTPQQTPERHLSGKQVIVGHTPQFSGDILNLGHIIGIDTFCFGDGWLTAFDVESGQIWQANNLGELRNDD